MESTRDLLPKGYPRNEHQGETRDDVSKSFGAEINVIVPDISQRDNQQLATSAKTINELTDPLRLDELISADEQRRLIYKFMGETRPE